MMAPKSRHDAPAIFARGNPCELAFDGALGRRGERFVVGDEDRLRALVVLGLRQQIGGDPVGIAGLVGDDQHLGRAGDHVDADFAEHDALGGRDIGVARPDDLGDRRDGLGAIGQGRDRLGAADAENLVDAGKLGGRQHQRIEFAARRRHHHGDPRHAGDLGRHRVHQHRGRISRGAARHIKPDRLDRGPARAELDAERIGEAIVLRHLTAVISLDAGAGEFECVERLAAARRNGRRDLVRGHADANAVEIELVEFERVVLERAIAAGGDVGDDGADGHVHVGCGLALGVEKSLEFFGEIAGADVEVDGHNTEPKFCPERCVAVDFAGVAALSSSPLYYNNSNIRLLD